MIDYVINDIITPLSLSDIHFGSYIEHLTDTFFHERHNSDFARNTVYPETEEQFTLRDDDKRYISYWRGEFWGKWIISACRVARYQNNEDLKRFVLKAAYNIIATADPDGYIGTYKYPNNVLPSDTERALRECGSKSDWNWNVWCRKYTLWGLLEVYLLTHDAKILEAAIKFTDQLLDMLDGMRMLITQCGTFNGLPSGSIMKPLLILYRITENKRYLDTAHMIADDWERSDNKVPNIIKNALSGKPVHEWYPYIGWAKAYEMMSCFDGIIELYRITGTKRYLTAAENFVSALVEHEQNVLFSVGFNDQFTNGASYPNALSEPCDVIHWIRICHELFKITGNVKYMDIIEKAFYNPMLASAFKDGLWGARCVRSTGRHLVAHMQANMQYSHCCVNNIPRGLLNSAECFVMKSRDGFVINMYSEFTAYYNGTKIVIGGDFIKDRKVTISIDAKESTILNFRIPDWSKYTNISGKTVERGNGYYSVEVDIGRTVIEIEFEIITTINTLKSAPEHFPSDDYRIRRYIQVNPVTEKEMTWDLRSTITYGPLLLTYSKLVGCTEEEMFDSQPFDSNIKVTQIDSQSKDIWYTFKVISGDRKSFMADYASGTNIESADDSRFFNIYI